MKSLDLFILDVLSCHHSILFFSHGIDLLLQVLVLFSELLVVLIEVGDLFFLLLDKVGVSAGDLSDFVFHLNLLCTLLFFNLLEHVFQLDDQLVTFLELSSVVLLLRD